MTTRRKFYVTNHNGRRCSLIAFLKAEGAYDKYPKIRQRLLREYRHTYLTEIVIPYNSVYLTEENLLEGAIAPSPRRCLVYVFLNQESGEVTTYYGRFPKGGEEICRLELEDMRFSNDGGNTWLTISNDRRVSKAVKRRRTKSNKLSVIRPST